MIDDTPVPPRRLPLFAGSVATALFLGEGASLAQATPPDTASSEAILVKGQPPLGYNADLPALAKLTQPIVNAAATGAALGAGAGFGIGRDSPRFRAIASIQIGFGGK